MKHTKKIHNLLAIAVLAVTASGLLAAAAPLVASANLSIDTVELLNSSPVAENISLTTYREVSVSDTFKSLDPEGDAVTYAVIDEPEKGHLSVEDNKFTYTPDKGKKGKDTFTYVAKDSAGNVSNKATVTITILKQNTDISYSDMSDNDAWYEATALAEQGIFIGEQVGDEYIFSPQSLVTRGEFLVMCMELTDTPLLSDITRTGFFDDEEIPMWQKPYVTTALVSDIIDGSSDELGRIVFAPNDNITFAEATVILNNVLDITDVESSGEFAAPSWAQQASANLISCDILPSSVLQESALSLTRADAAKMLINAGSVIEQRAKPASLLSWLFD